jgi:hypothetical protein
VHCVADCIANCVRFAVPKITEEQHIGNEIDAAFIFARADWQAFISRSVGKSYLNRNPISGLNIAKSYRQ